MSELDLTRGRHMMEKISDNPNEGLASLDGKNTVVVTGSASIKEGITTTCDLADSSLDDESQNASTKYGTLAAKVWAKRSPLIQAFVVCVFTAWWIVGLIFHRDRGWVVPFLIWLAIMIRVITFHIPALIFWRPVRFLWGHVIAVVYKIVPAKFRTLAAATLTVAVILVGAFATPDVEGNSRGDRAVSLFGLAMCIFAMWSTSRNRSLIKWHTVIAGMFAQFIIALFVLRSSVGYNIFNFISSLARDLLGFAKQGVIFLTSEDFLESASGNWFLISVLPAIVFFVSIVQLLFYYGACQWFIGKFSQIFFLSMRVSGAESVVATATPFIGQGESAMLIKPFIPHLTRAEIHQVMASGFATISGSGMVGYIALGVNPQALVCSCVMSIPASLAMSKLRYPETEETLTAGKVVIPEEEGEKMNNGLHAFAHGCWMGLKIAGMIGATLLCILALLALVNGLLTYWGHYWGFDNLTLEVIMGYLCYPIAFLLGVPRDDDLLKVAQLIGVKIIANEYVAYTYLTTEAAYASLSPRAHLVVTFALCGFGNIGSLGNQIGVLAQIAPGRSADVSRVAGSALITGIVSTLSSACIAALLVTDTSLYTNS